MSKVTYSIVPQRLAVGQGYVECAPHQACRFVILETKRIPARWGRKAVNHTRVIQRFTGAGAYAAATAELSRLVGKNSPKPKRAVRYRSLSQAEHDRLFDEYYNANLRSK